MNLPKIDARRTSEHHNSKLRGLLRKIGGRDISNPTRKRFRPARFISLCSYQVRRILASFGWSILALITKWLLAYAATVHGLYLLTFVNHIQFHNIHKPFLEWPTLLRPLSDMWGNVRQGPAMLLFNELGFSLSAFVSYRNLSNTKAWCNDEYFLLLKTFRSHKRRSFIHKALYRHDSRGDGLSLIKGMTSL